MPDPGPTPAESLGALLARIRTAQGKSQLRVAELLCAAAGTPTVTRHEVSRWEREQRVPSGHWLRWLAVVLDAPLPVLEEAAAVTRRLRVIGEGILPGYDAGVGAGMGADPNARADPASGAA